jgi:hypothetical protein
MKHLHNYARIHGVTFQNAVILVEGLIRVWRIEWYCVVCHHWGGGPKTLIVFEILCQKYSMYKLLLLSPLSAQEGPPNMFLN